MADADVRRRRGQDHRADRTTVVDPALCTGMSIRAWAANFAAMLVRRPAGRFVRRLARPIARILGVPTQAQLKATEDRAEARMHDLEDQVLQLVGRQTRLASDITTLVTRLTDLGTLHQVAPLSRSLDPVQL